MENPTRKKIAYYCLNDPLDKRSWSGIPFYLGQTLQNNIGDVDFLGPVKIPWLLEKAMRAIMKFTRNFLHTEYLPQYSLIKNRYASWYLKQRMRGKKYDFLLAPAAASELAFLDTDLPIIYFGDATFRSYSGTYRTVFENVNSLSKWEGDWLEKKSLRKSSLIILTSQWAADSAIQDYDTPSEKIVVLPFGANIDDVPPYDSIFIKENTPVLTLLFLAVDWERKGGPIAFDTLVQLNRSGVCAKLIVCGCVPPEEFNDPDMQVIPFLDKNLESDHTLFDALLTTVHFLILPTRADCTPVAFSECNAYGVPCITTDVGGVAGAVENGVNGYCLSATAGGAEYASLIGKVFSDKEHYHRLVADSRKKFDTELNWDTWAERFSTVLDDHPLGEGGNS